MWRGLNKMVIRSVEGYKRQLRTQKDKTGMSTKEG